tara:strand:+ start:239 stop:949 length:711 start_codon:yes stop_codon:yes gene_type:complete
MKKNNLIDFITESIKRNKNEQKEYSFGNGYVFLKDPLPDNVDLDFVLEKIEDIIPLELRDRVESVMVGDFEEFRERNINAMFKDGAIYLTNAQSSNDDMIDDIVHEIAHSVEEQYGYQIYALQPNITAEFRQKRIKLEEILKQQDINTQGFNFSDVEYNAEFDDYLYNTVGYPILQTLSVGLFPDAYGITSIREYFASGFEAYYLGNRDYLKRTSPIMYKKIKELLSDDNNYRPTS